MEAPTPRKSNRVPISLPAWLRALSTSCRLILDTMPKEDSDATGPGQTPCVAWAFWRGVSAWEQGSQAAFGRDFRYPSLCRRARRRQAGCPSGQRERSVKPSAKPTLVRTQHLPPPAETALGLGIPGLAGRLVVVPLGVMMRRCEPLHSSGYGHMADGTRPEQAVHRTACSWISMAHRPPPGLEDH